MKSNFGQYEPTQCPSGHRFPVVQLLRDDRKFVCTKCHCTWKALTRDERKEILESNPGLRKARQEGAK